MMSTCHLNTPRFNDCPLSLKLEHVAEPNEKMEERFDEAIHRALEEIVRDQIELTPNQPSIQEADALERWKQARQEHEIHDADLVEEGAAIVRAFVRRAGDCRDVVALDVGHYLDVDDDLAVFNVADCIRRIDESTIEVIDYRTDRQLLTQEEADASLKMSLSCLAAKARCPWAKSIQLTFDMLRHGTRISTTRTDEDLAAAVSHFEKLALQEAGDH